MSSETVSGFEQVAKAIRNMTYDAEVVLPNVASEQAAIGKGATEAETGGTRRLRVLLGWFILVVGLALLVRGLRAHPDILADVRSADGQTRFFAFSAGYVIAVLLLRLLAPRMLPFVLLAIGALAAIGAVGIGAPAAVGVFFLSSAVLGSRLFFDRNRPLDGLEDLLLAGLLGSTLFMTAVGFTAGIAIHYPIVHLVVLVTPIFLWRKETAQIIAGVGALLRPAKMPIDDRLYAALALTGFVLFLHFAGTLLPQVNNDAVAVHLGVPSAVEINHFWPFDFHRYVWAVQPMGISWMILPSYLLGGEFAARFINFAFFAIGALLLVTMMRRYVPVGTAWLLVAFYASTPFLLAETLNIFSENLWVALLLGGTIMLERFHRDGRSRDMVALCLLCAASLPVKVLGVFLVATLLAFTLPALLRRPRLALVTVAAFVVVGSYPYLVAYAKTGSPLFPYMNDIFRSPYYPPVAFAGAGRSLPTSLYELTFETAKFFDGGGRDGSFGFGCLVLLPFAVLALGRKMPFLGRVAIAVSVIFPISIMAFAEANLRYFYPALPFLILLLAVAMARGRFLSRSLHAAVCVLAVGFTALNAYAMPLSTWANRDFPLAALMTRDGIAAYRDWAAPERRLIDYLNVTRGKAARILFLSRPMLVDVEGDAVFSNWYNEEMRARLATARSSQDVLRIVRDAHITHIIGFAPGQPNSNGSAAIEAFLSEYTHPIFDAGDAAIYEYSSAVRFSDELLVDPKLDSPLAAWSSIGVVSILAPNGTVSMTADGALLQSVPVDARISYRYALTARCPVADTHVRLQVIWQDDAGTNLGAFVEPRACGAAFERFSTEVTPPAGATRGVAYVTGHEAGKVVEVTDVSLAW